MKKASLTKTEQRFLWTAALVCAGQDALCTLPGVGEQRAQAIIEYREQYGRFAAVEEAAAVPGLTEAVVEEWDGLAYVS